MKKSKTVFCGNLGVGKSALCKRLFLGEFDDCYHTTLNPNISEFNIENKILSIWDLPGEISPDKIPSAYLSNTDKICYIFDVSKPDYFKRAYFDIQYLSENLPNVQLIVAANKSDLIQFDDLDKSLAVLPFVPDFILSAKEASGVENLYKLLIE